MLNELRIKLKKAEDKLFITNCILEDKKYNMNVKNCAYDKKIILEAFISDYRQKITTIEKLQNWRKERIRQRILKVWS